MDLIQYISTAIITIMNLPQEESSFKKEQRVFAAFSLLLLWTKLFDWLKLFDKTAFYIKLLDRTLRDTVYFMLLFIIALAMFASSFLMMQNNKGYGN